MENRTGHNNLFDRLQNYSEQQSTPLSDLLNQLERETHLKTLTPHMISGPLQGQFLRLFSQWLRPRRILEIGTFTGYATLCLAEGLHPEGELHTIEGNPELEYLIRKYVNQSSHAGQIHLHIGDALDVIPELPGTFDLVFIDAAKQYYQAFYDLIIDRLDPGGCILADNVLWSGKVLHTEKDDDTAHIHAFNQMVRADKRVDSLILPLRDGILMARKR